MRFSLGEVRFCEVSTGDGFGGSGTELYDTVRDCTDVSWRPMGVKNTIWNGTDGLWVWQTLYGMVRMAYYGCVRDYMGVYGCVRDYTDGLRVWKTLYGMVRMAYGGEKHYTEWMAYGCAKHYMEWYGGLRV